MQCRAPGPPDLLRPTTVRDATDTQSSLLDEPLAEGERGAPGITLVLGGGGFKGMSHVGVLQVLESEGIAIERVVGTSAGALIGAAYAHRGQADDVRARVEAFVLSDAFQRKGFVSFSAGTGEPGLLSRVVSGIKRQVALERMFRRSSAFGSAALRFVVRSLVPNVPLEEMAVPMAVTTLDLVAGEEVILTEGPAASAVCASSSVPGFFPPVERDGRLLVDAGIVANLPTRAARSLGASRVVAVDLSQTIVMEGRADIGMDVLLRAQDISTMHTSRRLADLADVLILPDNGGRSWLDSTDPTAVVAAGAEATRRALPAIRSLLANA